MNKTLLFIKDNILIIAILAGILFTGYDNWNQNREINRLRETIVNNLDKKENKIDKKFEVDKRNWKNTIKSVNALLKNKDAEIKDIEKEITNELSKEIEVKDKEEALAILKEHGIDIIGNN
jgi:glycosylphosphatidylinositol transamidase (GPIT) subunit GPI8